MAHPGQTALANFGLRALDTYGGFIYFIFFLFIYLFIFFFLPFYIRGILLKMGKIRRKLQPNAHGYFWRLAF